MAKKIDRFTGMQDMFEQASNDKMEKLIAAKAKIESEIRALESGMDNEYDNGIGNIEDRNELNALNNELRDIEQEIAQIKQNDR